MLMRWKSKFWILVAIVAAIVGIDLAFGAHLFGSTMRFFWNGAIWVVFLFLRTAEASAMLAVPFLRRQGVKLTKMVTKVGAGYASSVILSDHKVREARTLSEKVRAAITRMRAKWIALPTVWKLVVVAVLIVTQIYLFPTLSTYAVLFPIGFLAPLLRFIAVRVADSMVGRFYRRYCGSFHRKLVGFFEAIPFLRQIRDGVYLLRLQYLTAWRMWKHEPCYRLREGKRRISLYEPIRLWWLGELDRYRGKPLCSGGKHVREPSSYVPPPLWYEHDRPLARVGMIIAASLITLFALKSSTKRS